MILNVIPIYKKLKQTNQEHTRSMKFKLLVVILNVVSITFNYLNRKNDLILIMTPEKQDKSTDQCLLKSKDSTLARNEVIMKRTYSVKSIKCNKICSNY